MNIPLNGNTHKMNILAIETTGAVAGVALVCPNRIIAEFSVNNGMTHSALLMPLIDAMLTSAAFDKRDIDYIACSAGPGSFTGLRIGAAAAKGLAFALSRQIVRVSTLDAMAYNVFSGTDGIVAPIMDARRNQVYAALYEHHGGTSRRLTEDLACDFEHIAHLAESAAINHGLPITFLGDGCAVHKDKIELMQNACIAPIERRLQRAVSVGVLALQAIEVGCAAVDPADFEPSYVRPSQAEREASES